MSASRTDTKGTGLGCLRHRSRAVVTWLKNKVHLIESPDELEGLIQEANQNDRSYIVSAFTGLGAPWWDNGATDMLTDVTTLTGRAEIAKTCAECIPYQIADALDALRADGGVTKNAHLMQFQADMAPEKAPTAPPSSPRPGPGAGPFPHAAPRIIGVR